MNECEYRGRRCFLIPSEENLGINQCADHVEPDGHIYLRCQYFSNRTRIKCPSVRRADDLKPFGYCEKHTGYIERIRRDALRARQILDPGYSKENAEGPSFSSDEIDETLDDSSQNWPYVYESLYCDTRLDDPDNPLRNAGVFTPKEVVQQYFDALERHKQALVELRAIYAEKHRRLIADYKKRKANAAESAAEKLLLDPKNSAAKNKKLLAEFKAYKKYGSYVQWRRSAYYMDKVQSQQPDSSNSAASRNNNNNIGEKGAASCATASFPPLPQPSLVTPLKSARKPTDNTPAGGVRKSESADSLALFLSPGDLDSTAIGAEEASRAGGVDGSTFREDAPLTSLHFGALKPPRGSKCQHIERINHGKPKLPPFESGDGKNDAQSASDDVCRDVLGRVVDYVEFCARPVVDVIESKACESARIPLTDFCSKHILSDFRQILYEKCVDCDAPALPWTDFHKCRVHYERMQPSATRNQSDVIIGEDIDEDTYIQMCIKLQNQQKSAGRTPSATNLHRHAMGEGGGMANGNGFASGSGIVANNGHYHHASLHHHPQQQQPSLSRMSGSSSTAAMMFAAQQQHHSPHVDIHHHPHHNHHHLHFGQPPVAQPQPLHDSHGKGATWRPTPLETDTCARVRPYEPSGSKNMRGRNLSTSSSAGSICYQAQQRPGGSLVLSPKPAGSITAAGGHSHASSSSTHSGYSPPLSPYCSAPPPTTAAGASVSLESGMKMGMGGGGMLRQQQQRQTSVLPQHVQQQLAARRISSQLNNASPVASASNSSSSFHYSPIQRRPPAGPPSAAIAHAIGPYMRLVNNNGGGARGASGIGGVVVPPLAKMARRGGRGGAQSTPFLGGARVFNSTEEYEKQRQQYEQQEHQKQQHHHQQFQATYPNQPRIFPQPKRQISAPHPQAVVRTGGAQKLAAVNDGNQLVYQHIPNSGVNGASPMITPLTAARRQISPKDATATSTTTFSRSVSMSAARIDDGAMTASSSSPPPPLFTPDNTIGRSVESVVRPNVKNGNGAGGESTTGMRINKPFSILARRPPAAVVTVQRASFASGAPPAANTTFSAAAITASTPVDPATIGLGGSSDHSPSPAAAVALLNDVEARVNHVASESGGK